MKKLLLLLLTAVCLCSFGCASMMPPSEADLAAADYGEYPEKYDQIIKDYCQTYLKEPETATYRFPKPPIKGYTSDVRGNTYGYRGDVWIKAKNSYDGFSDDKYYYLIRNGKVMGLKQYEE